MTFSALQILVFHLWLFVMQDNEVEIFIKQMSYIGVDTFFFVSAYSLADRPINSYKQFISNRLIFVYLKFVLFSLVAFVYFGWSFSYLVSVLTGVDLLRKGGGAFLWFLPAIMLFYIIFPLFKKCDDKNRLLTFISVVCIWLFMYIFIPRQVCIFWNRVPIIMLGYYTSVYRCKYRIRLGVGLGLIVIGVLLAYKFAFRAKLQYPVYDMYYITVIPLVLGLIMLISMIPVNKITRLIGYSTLEIYAIQMIFGYRIVNKLIKFIDNKLLINILSLTFIISVSVVISCSYKLIVDLIIGRKQ